METAKSLDELRESALVQVEKSERRVKTLVGCAALIEGGLLITFLSLMNFHDRLHWLILVAAFLTYGTLSVGLITIGAYINLNAQRILKAVALLDTQG